MVHALQGVVVQARLSRRQHNHLVVVVQAPHRLVAVKVKVVVALRVCSVATNDDLAASVWNEDVVIKTLSSSLCLGRTARDQNKKS